MAVAKIMVVDDTAFMRIMLRDILTSNGFEVVVEAASGEQAVQAFKRFRPDLVTMDITMPEMDGISALKEIRKWDPRARIIMCSAMGQHDRVIEAIMAGAKDFLVKPFHKDRVLESVIKVLQDPECMKADG